MTTTITRAIVTCAQRLYVHVLLPLHIRNLDRESERAASHSARKFQVADRLSEAAAAAYEGASLAAAVADEVKQRNHKETIQLLKAGL